MAMMSMAMMWERGLNRFRYWLDHRAIRLNVPVKTDTVNCVGFFCAPTGRYPCGCWS